MTKSHFAIFAALASLLLAACEESTRKYPRGYTDDGIRFDEDGWRYFPGMERIGLTYFGETGRSQLTISCDLDQSGADPAITRMIGLQKITVTTYGFSPLSQWPQPDLTVKVGEIELGGLNEITISKGGSTSLRAHFEKRDKFQMISAISRGTPITLGFGDQSLEAPGVPQSMREGFVRKCRGDK